MPITAKISKSYRWRIGIIGLGLLAFSAWFFYDWAVRYPAKRHRQLEYQRIYEQNPIDKAGPKWQAYAREQGWSIESPGEPMSMADINTQLWYGVPCLILSLPILGAFVLMGRRYVAADEEALYDHRGRRAWWDGINDIDKSRWQTKGIAAVYYTDASNQTKKIVLDDWKYQREPIQQILAHVESKVYPEQEPLDDDQASPEDTPGEYEQVDGVGDARTNQSPRESSDQQTDAA